MLPFGTRAPQTPKIPKSSNFLPSFVVVLITSRESSSIGEHLWEHSWIPPSTYNHNHNSAMAYLVTYRPAVLLFFFIRQPVAAASIVGMFALWEADRNLGLGIRDTFNEWRNTALGFSTVKTQYEAFKKIDEEKRNELLLKQ